MAAATPDDVAVAVDGGAAGAGAGAGAGGASARAASRHELKVLVCSWNVGNKPPPESMAPWLPTGGGGYDIIAVGVQESKYSVKASDGTVTATPHPATAATSADESKDGAAGAPPAPRSATDGKEPEDHVSAQHFFKCVQTQVGSKYFTVETVQLWEMRLIVLARKPLRSKIEDVHKAWEATGMFSVLGNKGGLVVKFNVNGTSLCFVSCHLAAHAHKLQQRNSNVEEVLQEIRMGPNPAVDIDNQFHHVFWFGDLNYRVQLDTLDQKKRELQAHIDEVKTMIEGQQWQGLLAADQLQQAMTVKKELFPGFQAPMPAFAPTFKVERKPGFIYQTEKLRVPSYCDRVLWKSMAGRKPEARLRTFSAFPEIFTSDHKPVHASFSVLCKPSPALSSDVAKFPQVLITNLRCKNLHKADANGLADPYVVLESDPPQLFGKGKAPQTGTVMKNLSPKFADDSIGELHARVTSKEDLSRCSILFAVWDYDVVTPDDPMGQVSVSLRDFVRRAGPQKFRAPLSLHGLARGSISGTLEIVWPSDPRHTAAKARDAEPRPGCCTVM